MGIGDDVARVRHAAKNVGFDTAATCGEEENRGHLECARKKHVIEKAHARLLAADHFHSETIFGLLLADQDADTSVERRVGECRSKRRCTSASLIDAPGLHERLDGENLSLLLEQTVRKPSRTLIESPQRLQRARSHKTERTLQQAELGLWRGRGS
jgi:hypothetical protein